jgi:hypothetical protein
MRYAPRWRVDDQELRSRIGNIAMDGLIVPRRLAIFAMFLIAVPLGLMAPIFRDFGRRRLALMASGAILTGSLCVMAWVEIRYRSLIRRWAITTKMIG